VKNGIADCLAAAVGAVAARRHAEAGGRLFVEARGRAVTCVEQRLGDSAAILERGLDRFQALRILVVARGDAERLLEAALQVERARADRARISSSVTRSPRRSSR